jgi:hypothetical protein
MSIADQIRRLLASAPPGDSRPAAGPPDPLGPLSPAPLPQLDLIRRHLNAHAPQTPGSTPWHRRCSPFESVRQGTARNSAPPTRHPLLTWMESGGDPVAHIRLVHWPRGIPSGSFLGLLSSRLQRDLARHRDWFAALRELDAEASPETVFVTAPTTTCFPFVQRLAAHRPRRLVTVHPPAREHLLIGDWWKQLTSLRFAPHDRHFPAWISPRIPLPTPFRHPQLVRSPHRELLPHIAPYQDHPEFPPGPTPPRADQAVAWLSDDLILLRLRPGGRLLPWIHQMLRDTPPSSMARVLLAAGPGLVPPHVAKRLIGEGAMWWRSFPTTPPQAPTHSRRIHAGSPSRTSRIHAVPSHSTEAPAPLTPPAAPDRAPPDRSPQVHEPSSHGPEVLGASHSLPPHESSWIYLTHCTRPRHGPWPDQTDDEYRDQLLWNGPDTARGPLETLRHIATTRRLYASHAGIRGGAQVVCWSELPLEQLARLHVYRPHRVRWDFCPYGICIHREWLRDRGARPVLYGTEACWESLPDQDRPFFQTLTSRTSTSRAQRLRAELDWSREREWRTPGDLALDDLPANAAFLFVPTSRDVELLAPYSPWPIRLAPACWSRRSQL